MDIKIRIKHIGATEWEKEYIDVPLIEASQDVLIVYDENWMWEIFESGIYEWEIEGCRRAIVDTDGNIVYESTNWDSSSFVYGASISEFSDHIKDIFDAARVEADWLDENGSDDYYMNASIALESVICEYGYEYTYVY